MARRPEGWTLVLDRRTGTWCVRWRTPDGKRLMRSTGERDRAAAQAAAPGIVALASRGTSRVARGRTPLTPRLIAEWLADYGASHSTETVEALGRYSTAHWLPRWSSIEEMDSQALGVYVRERLRVVTASSVRKETSGLRALLAWLVETDRLAAAPEVPSVAKRATGTRYEGGTRQPRRVELDPATVLRLIAALPEETRHGHPARDAVELMWETTLRIATIERIERPRHYRPGADRLTITADIDKARMARRLPLSDRARAILDRRATKDGLVFGPMHLRYALEQAAISVGIPEDDARRVGPHDIRHAAITDLVTRPGVSIGGAAYLAGHRHVSTTALYSHPGEEAAEEALRARIGIPKRDTAKRPKRNPKK